MSSVRESAELSTCVACPGCVQEIAAACCSPSFVGQLAVPAAVAAQHAQAEGVAVATAGKTEKNEISVVNAARGWQAAAKLGPADLVSAALADVVQTHF